MNTPVHDKIISIIVPIYNSEQWIDKCISSIVHQTYRSLEIILVNDGSTDGSDAICKAWQQRDPRIKYHHQSNAGVSVARNEGLSKATGEYLCFIDSDDWIERTHIETLYNGTVQNNTDLFTTGYTKREVKTSACHVFLPPNINSIDLSSPTGETGLLELLKSRLLFSPVAHIFKTSIIKNNELTFKEGVHFGEDRLFILNYLKQCTKIGARCLSTYNYRMENPKSLSNLPPEEILPAEKLFFHAYSDFFEALNYKSPCIKQWMCTPLFNAYIDDLFIFPGKNLISLIKKVKTLTSCALFNYAFKHADLSTYSKSWILMIKMKLNIILALLLFIKQQKNIA